MSKIRYGGPEPKPARLSEFLRGLREARGLRLREVADAASMDLAHLQKIEHGQRLPTEEQCWRLARFYKLDETEIQARRIVERFQNDYAENPAAKQAIGILADGAGISAPRARTPKPPRGRSA